MSETKGMWLFGGQYFCDNHKPPTCIPFFFAPKDAKCAECSQDAEESYLKRTASHV